VCVFPPVCFPSSSIVRFCNEIRAPAYQLLLVRPGAPHTQGNGEWEIMEKSKRRRRRQAMKNTIYDIINQRAPQPKNIILKKNQRVHQVHSTGLGPFFFFFVFLGLG
jgi:hypothetical protein